MKKCIKIVFLSLCIAGLILPSSVFALSSGGVGGYPANPDPKVRFSESWFIYNLGPNETKNDGIIIVNTSEEEHTVKLYPVDSIPSNQGNFALKKEEEPREGIGAWIQLEEDLITLAPGETKRVNFTITIPESVDVGEHSGGIIIQKAQKNDVSGTGASIVTRVGVRVYNTVPGEIVRKIRLGDFIVEKKRPDNKDPFYEIALTAFNESNITLQPLSTLIIKGWGKTEYLKKTETASGEVVVNLGDVFNFSTEEVSEREWQLLRDSKVSTRWEWPVPEFGRYSFQVRVEFEGNDGEVEALYTPEVTIWVIPWFELGVISGLLLLIILGVVLKKTVFGVRKWQTYKVKRGQDVFDIAEESGVKWEKIVKVNNLSTPKVKAGEVILVPPSFNVPEDQTGPTKKAMKKKSSKKNVESAAQKTPKKNSESKTKSSKSSDELVQPKRGLKRYIWIIAVVVVVLIVGIVAVKSLTGDADKPQTDEQAETNEPVSTEQTVEEPAAQPSDFTIAIYDPQFPTSTASTTLLLQKRIDDLGFNSLITGELIDENAAYQDKTTLLIKESSIEALELFAEKLLNTTTYQQGINPNLTEDIVISTWYVEEINWGKNLESEAFELLNYDPESVSIAILNGGAAPGSAGDLAAVLADADYTQVTAANAEDPSDKPVIIYHQHTYGKTADKIRDILRLNGFSGVHLEFRQDQGTNIVILLGTEDSEN